MSGMFCPNTEEKHIFVKKFQGEVFFFFPYQKPAMVAFYLSFISHKSQLNMLLNVTVIKYAIVKSFEPYHMKTSSVLHEMCQLDHHGAIFN